MTLKSVILALTSSRNLRSTYPIAYESSLDDYLIGTPNSTRLKMKSSPLKLLPTLLMTSDVVRESNVAAYNEVVERKQDEGSLV